MLQAHTNQRVDAQAGEDHGSVVRFMPPTGPEISERAYILFKRSGDKCGCGVANWIAAEQELRREALNRFWIAQERQRRREMLTRKVRHDKPSTSGIDWVQAGREMRAACRETEACSSWPPDVMHGRTRP